MKLLRLALVQVFFFIMAAQVAFGQQDACYKQLEDASGYDATAFLNTLLPKACALRGKFPGSLLPTEFGVYDFGYYPHTAKYQGDFKSALLNSDEFRDSITTEYYLIIAKTTTAQGVYSGYEVLLNLPGVAPFDSLTSTDITAIARLVKLEIESIHAPGGGVTYSEAGIGAGLDLLAVIIESIVDRTFSLTEMQMLALNDFFEMPIGDASVTHSGIPTIDEAGFFDYAGLVSNDDGALLKDAIFASWELEQGEMNYVITDSENLDGFQGGQFNAAHSKFKDAGSYYVFWYHFILPDAGSGDPLRLFVKTRTNLTEEQALNLLYNKYLESKSTSQNAAIGSDDNTAEMRMSPSDTCGTGSCKMEASWIKNCLLPKYASVRTDLLEYLDIPDVGVDYVDFKVGVLAGVYDGIFDILILLIDGGKFLYEGAQDNIFQSDTWKNKSRWGKALELGKIVALGPIAGPAYIFYGDEMADAYQAIKGLIDSEGFGALLKPILEELNTFFTDLSFQNGTICAGYAAGIIVFEVATSILTGGTSQFKTVFKLTYKSMKESLQAAGSAAGKAIAQIGNNPGKFLKCRVLMQGCFVAGTPVLMASNPIRVNAKTLAIAAAMPLVMPIQNITTDDMVKAYHHEDTYLTASTNEDDIYVPGWQDYDYLEITPETWQIGKFVIAEANGNLVEIEANRPKEWFTDQGLFKKGDETFLSISEMGIADYAVLQSIRPTIIDTRNFAINESGMIDRPVITTYKRIADEISDYIFSNVDHKGYPDRGIESQTISCTPNHLFYSTDRQTYVPIEDLNFGESILTSSDREVKFIGGKSREKGEHVYNFEVWREHNYYVGSDGSEEFLLVHNSCWSVFTDFLQDLKNYINSFPGPELWKSKLLQETEQVTMDAVLATGKKAKSEALKAFAKLGKDFEEIFAKNLVKNQFAQNGHRITLKIKRGAETFNIIPDFVVKSNGKYKIIDAKFTKKIASEFDIDKSLTANQKKFKKWFQDGQPFEVEVRANSSKLNDLDIDTGDIIDIDAFDILKSAANDINIGYIIPGF